MTNLENPKERALFLLHSINIYLGQIATNLGIDGAEGLYNIPLPEEAGLTQDDYLVRLGEAQRPVFAHFRGKEAESRDIYTNAFLRTALLSLVEANGTLLTPSVLTLRLAEHLQHALQVKYPDLTVEQFESQFDDSLSAYIINVIFILAEERGRHFL